MATSPLINSNTPDFGEKMGRRLLACSAFVATAMTGLILVFLLYFSWPLFREGKWHLLCQWDWMPVKEQWGVCSMILGSLLTATLATVIALPLALGLCSFVVAMGPKFLRRWFRRAVVLMISVPTVVLALVSVTTLVPLIRAFDRGSGYSWLATSLTLSVLILPTASLALLSTLEEKWREHRVSTAALGFSPAQTLLSVVFPESTTAIGASFILAWARALGDTMIALMLSGNAPHLPHGLFDTLRTLTAHMALVVQGDTEHSSYHVIFFCGLLLFLMTASARALIKRVER